MKTFFLAFLHIKMNTKNSHQISIERLRNDEKVCTLAKEKYCPEAAYQALLYVRGNINKARHMLFQGLITNEGTSPLEFLNTPQTNNGPNKAEKEINSNDKNGEIKKESTIDSLLETNIAQNQPRLCENEQVLTLVNEGFSPDASFKALLKYQGNIYKARRFLESHRNE